tara:strand:+ start:784 stop:993 length:210 start_codon:yes stop_codon:yes gene_type:complete
VQFAIGRRSNEERSILQPKFPNDLLQGRAVMSVTHDDPPPSAKFRISADLCKGTGKNGKTFVLLNTAHT